MLNTTTIIVFLITYLFAYSLIDRICKCVEHCAAKAAGNDAEE